MLKVNGKGMPVRKGGRLGDLFIQVSVGIPNKINKEQKAYLEKFEKLFGEYTLKDNQKKL